MNKIEGTETLSGLHRRRILRGAGLGGLAGLGGGGALALLGACGHGAGCVGWAVPGAPRGAWCSSTM